MQSTTKDSGARCQLRPQCCVPAKWGIESANVEILPGLGLHSCDNMSHCDNHISRLSWACFNLIDNFAQASAPKNLCITLHNIYT